MIEWRFRAPVIEWRGPAPFFYARIPETVGDEIAAVKRAASYGWGAIPVRATILGVTFETSLFPKDGTYLLPLKAAVRKRIGVTVGDEVEVEMAIGGAIREPGSVERYSRDPPRVWRWRPVRRHGRGLAGSPSRTCRIRTGPRIETKPPIAHEDRRVGWPGPRRP